MDALVLRSFGSELEKLAVSAATTLSLLQQRAAQGARVAPALMQRAETAAAQGLTHTPAAARRAALGAGESVRAAQGAEQLATRSGTAAQRAALQSRGAQMTQAIESAPHTVTSPMLGGNMTRGYSPAAADFMAGKGTLAQAQAHTLSNPTIHQVGRTPAAGRQPSMSHATPPMGASSAGGTTAVSSGVDLYGKTVVDWDTAKTQVGLVGGSHTGGALSGKPYVPPLSASQQAQGATNPGIRMRRAA